MRGSWLIPLGLALCQSLSADDRVPSGIVMRDFSVTDSPCGYKHDNSVEEYLQSTKTAIDPATAKANRAITLELRNNSLKAITAYVLNYTLTHGDKTHYYAGQGVDLIYEMALGKSDGQQIPNSTLPPGGIIRQELKGSNVQGKLQVYPCMVLFDDGTFVGPPLLAKFVREMRADSASSFGALTADLKSARESSDPKSFLLHRAKQIQRTKGKRGERSYRYLEVVASALSRNGDVLQDRASISKFIAGLQTQQDMLIEASR